jgi:acyl-CoA thioesterase I
MRKISFIIAFLSIVIFGCSSESNFQKSQQTPISNVKEYKYLALGDSYTIGESVCETCRFPEQLKKGLKDNFTNDTFSLQIIAQTGWTTTNLISAINTTLPTNNYDLVTLLIGVNNQYQNKAFSVYEEEFPMLVNRAIGFAKADKSNVIVVSIPDYAYTPFGQGAANISTAIDKYNDFAKLYCMQNNIKFIDITDVTRLGLVNTNLVASDGLHPSELAYTKFVERILPEAINILKN